MELREFIKVFKKYSMIFWSIFLVVFLIGLVWYDRNSQLYSSSLAINVTRSGQSQNKEYQYDQYYRLQADEKFGKNVVNWIDDPGFMNKSKNDFENNETGHWENIFNIKTVQLSSNYIKVEYKSKDPRSAVLFGKILKKNLEDKNSELNTDQNENWFKLVVDEAYVAKNNINILAFWLIVIVLGTLFGTLGVLLRHYFNISEDENRN